MKYGVSPEALAVAYALDRLPKEVFKHFAEAINSFAGPAPEQVFAVVNYDNLIGEYDAQFRKFATGELLTLTVKGFVNAS